MRIIKWLLPLLIFIVGVIGFVLLISNPPASRKKSVPPSRLVRVNSIPIVAQPHTVSLFAMGQVVPALETIVKTQVSGEIVKINPEFVPGGRINQGEPILMLDPSDYQLAVSKQVAQVQQAEAELALEMGRQTVAKDELALISKATGQQFKNARLALRQPQLAQARANVAIAKADLARAQLDQTRTLLHAPYNALVISRQSSIGDKVNLQDSLARIVSTDSYWIMTSLPVKDLAFIESPRNGKLGSKVIVNLDNNRGTRSGQLFKITGQMNANSRLVECLIQVNDPLALHSEKSPLILNDYVGLTFIGKKLEHVVAVPMESVRDQNTIWIARNNHLKILSLKPIVQSENTLLVENQFQAHDRLITTNLTVVVDNMPIQLADSDE